MCSTHTQLWEALGEEGSLGGIKELLFDVLYHYPDMSLDLVAQLSRLVLIVPGR